MKKLFKSLVAVILSAIMVVPAYASNMGTAYSTDSIVEIHTNPDGTKWCIAMLPETDIKYVHIGALSKPNGDAMIFNTDGTSQEVSEFTDEYTWISTFDGMYTDIYGNTYDIGRDPEYEYLGVTINGKYTFDVDMEPSENYLTGMNVQSGIAVSSPCCWVNDKRAYMGTYVFDFYWDSYGSGLVASVTRYDIDSATGDVVTYSSPLTLVN